jgi:hypothetical protein
MFHPRISYGGLQEDSHNAAKSRLARRATRNTPVAKPALGNGHVQRLATGVEVSGRFPTSCLPHLRARRIQARRHERAR